MTTVYRDIPFACCDPVVIFDVSSGRVLHSATGVLLTFDRLRTFLITNSHVLSAFRKSIVEHPSAIFAVGDNLPFDPLSRIVDESNRRDIAVIDVSDLEFLRRLSPQSSIGPLRAHVADPWPPPQLRQGDSVVFGGWLETHRRQEGEHVEFVATPYIGLRVDDVAPEFATLTFERTFYVASDGTTSHPILNETDLSGLSGSPVFSIVSLPIEHAVLIGIVRDHLRQHDVVRVALINSLTANGRLGGEAEEIGTI